MGNVMNIDIVTDDGCLPAAILAQDEGEGREEVDVLSVILGGTEGSDTLDLHFLYLSH